MKAGLHIPDVSSVTVAKAAENWITSGETADPPLERTSLAQRRQHVTLGNMKLNKLTVPAIRAFQDSSAPPNVGRLWSAS